MLRGEDIFNQEKVGKMEVALYYYKTTGKNKFSVRPIIQLITQMQKECTAKHSVNNPIIYSNGYMVWTI